MESMRLQQFAYVIAFFLLAQRASAQRVLINEILPAPSGAQFEFIELIFEGESSVVPGEIYLRDNSINWSPVRFERPLTAQDTLVLVRSFAEAQDLVRAGIAVGTLSPWPSLNNGGDSLFVRIGTALLDRMGYTSSTSNVSWERKAPYLPSLSPSSWMLSKSSSGGSPGRTNTVFSRDLRPPRLLGAEYRDGQRIVAWFSEPMPGHTEILFEMGSGPTVVGSGQSTPHENRVTLELNGQSAPEWLKVTRFIDYAGNVGNPTTVIIASPPEEGDLFFSEVHFMEGGSGLSDGAPEFFELLSTAEKSVSLHKATVVFRGSSFALFHPDSMAILPPFRTFLAAAKPWQSWGDTRWNNDLWLTANQPNPFIPPDNSSALPLFGLAPWISFKNEGESLGLWIDGLQFDTVVFDQSCFDTRFADHRGRSLSRILFQTKDLKITADPRLGHLVENYPAAVPRCLWASTLFSSGISPGSVVDPIYPAVPPSPGSLLVTEVMYDPISASTDFVYDQVEFIEFINVSAEPVQLQDLWLATDPDEEGSFDQFRLGSSPVTLFPGQIGVLFHFPPSIPDQSLGEHQLLARAWPQAAMQWPGAVQAWPGAAQARLAAVKAWPAAARAGSAYPISAENGAMIRNYEIVFIPTRKSLGLPNFEGRYRIINSTGEEVARLDYDTEDHYRGLESTKGRSLFRPSLAAGIDVLPSQFGPWTTSTSAEGATPGVVLTRTTPIQGANSLLVTPLSFYPSRIDLDHEVLIQVPPISEGLAFTLEVFDRHGYVAATLSRGQFLDNGWTTSWRGLNDLGLPCPRGTYIAVARIFDSKGREIRRFKQPISLIR